MFKVYYTAPLTDTIMSETFAETEMSEALTFSQKVRNMGASFVTMACENTNSVGVMGVDAVKDGKLPNGEDYTWKKRRWCNAD